MEHHELDHPFNWPGLLKNSNNYLKKRYREKLFSSKNLYFITDWNGNYVALVWFCLHSDLLGIRNGQAGPVHIDFKEDAFKKVYQQQLLSNLW